MAEYRGYRVTQDRKSHHVIVSKDGQMVMHIPCKEHKTKAELEGFVDFYETAVGKLRRQELRPVQCEEEIRCQAGTD